MEACGKVYIEHPSRSDKIRIWNLADVHLFNGGCAVKRFREDVKSIAADPYSFVVGGGDYADYISPTDPRWDASCIGRAMDVTDLGQLGLFQTEAVCNELRPLQNKLIGLLMGNHEKKYQKTKEQSFLHDYLCKSLKVPNLEYSAIFDVVLIRNTRIKKPRLSFQVDGEKAPNVPSSGTRFTVRFYCHHGAGGATTPGGKLNKLIKFMHFFDAQIYFIGHVHGSSGHRMVSIGADSPCTKLVERERVGVITGTYLRTYAPGITTYGEVAAYSPTALGAASVTIDPDKGTITPNI